jgi:hypothetical protein
MSYGRKYGEITTVGDTRFCTSRSVRAARVTSTKQDIRILLTDMLGRSAERLEEVPDRDEGEEEEGLWSHDQ